MADHSSADARLALVAATQHGNVTRHQAHDCGLTNSQLAHRVAVGRLHQTHRGVFTVAGTPSTFRQRQMAACLAVRSGYAACEAAAILHAFEPAPSPRLVVLTELGGTSRVAGAHLHRSRFLPERHVTVVDGIPTTTVVRTIIDLAAVYQRRRLVETLEWALTARRLDITELVDEFNAMARSGRRGARLLRPLIVERSDGLAVPASVLERQMRTMLDGSDLPTPIAQWSPPWGGTLIARVDFAFLDERLVIEVDGRRWHTREADFDTDPRRDQLAATVGWQVLHFPYRQVTQEPDETIEIVRATLERRRIDLPVPTTRPD